MKNPNQKHKKETTTKQLRKNTKKTNKPKTYINNSKNKREKQNNINTKGKILIKTPINDILKFNEVDFNS